MNADAVQRGRPIRVMVAVVAGVLAAPREIGRAAADLWRHDWSLAVMMALYLGAGVFLTAAAIEDWARTDEARGQSEALRAHDPLSRAVKLAPSYGALVREARERWALDADTLAGLMEIDRYALEEIEAGRRPMTRSQFERAGDVLALDEGAFSDLGGIAALPTAADLDEALAHATAQE